MMKAMKFSWAFGLLGAATFCGCSETQSSISPPPQQNVEASTPSDSARHVAQTAGIGIESRPATLKRLPTVDDAGQLVHRSPSSILKEFAGKYYKGDGLGLNLSLTMQPSGQFSLVLSGCMGVYEQDAGTIELRDGIFILHTQAVGTGFDKQQLLPIRWGERHYLIDVDRILTFCNDVNRGSEPRNGPHGSNLLRDGDCSLPVTGLPDVPQQWQQYLYPPAQGEIVQVLENGTAVASLGAKDGVQFGMALYASHSRYFVFSVSESECILGSVIIGGEVNFRVGDLVSTKRYVPQSTNTMVIGRPSEAAEIRPITKADNVLAVYIQDSRWGAGPNRLVVAVWHDGFVVWSENRTAGGAPYRSGRVSPEKVAAVLAQMKR